MSLKRDWLEWEVGKASDGWKELIDGEERVIRK